MPLLVYNILGPIDLNDFFDCALSGEHGNATICIVVGDDSVERIKVVFNVKYKYNNFIKAIGNDHCSIGEVRSILRENPDFAAWVTDCGWTALHEAARRGKPNFARMILDTYGSSISLTLGGRVLTARTECDVHAIDNSGYSALHMAARAGCHDTCAFLLERGAFVNANSFNNSTPLHLAAEKGSLRLCAMLLDRGAKLSAHRDDNASPLHIAIRYGNFDAASLFIRRGANVNERTDDSQSSLYLAVHYTYLNSHCKTPDEIINLFKLLLDHGADPGSLGGPENSSPFRLAAIRDIDYLCELFLQYDAAIGDWDPKHSEFSASVTDVLTVDANALTHYFRNAVDGD